MKIVVSGYYGFGNLGDEAILEVLVDLIKNCDPTFEIVVLSARAKETAEKLKVKAISRNDFLIILKEIKSADLFISGGGGLLQDVTSKRSLYYYLALILTAQTFKIPTILLAQGIGPLTSPLSISLLSNVLKKTTAISVRDKVSYELVKLLGYRGNLQLTADLAFLLKPDVQKAKDLLYKIGINESPYIFLSPSKAVDNPTSIEALIQSVLFLREEFGFEILVSPFYQRADKNASKLICERLKKRAFYLNEEVSPKIMLGIIGASKLVLASRLHPLISAAVTGIPFLGIAYDPKLKNLVDEIGVGVILPMDKINPADIIYELTNILDNKNFYKNKLNENVLLMMERAELNRSFISNSILLKDF